MFIRIAHGPIVGMSSYRQLQWLIENRVTNAHLFVSKGGDVQVVDMLRDSDAGVQAQALLTLSKQGWKTENRSKQMEFGVTQFHVSCCQANEVLDIAIKLCGNSLIQSRTSLGQRLEQVKIRH